MAFITFVTPYKPIICGIADYTDFLVRESLPGTCDVLSFNLENYGVPLHNAPTSLTCPVWYGIPGRDNFSASSILEGLRPHEDHVLWFQHEFGIWSDSARFVDMLRNLNQIKVVSPHSLHFQNSETLYGLRRQEYSFLRLLLPHTDAITVFSDGIYQAITRAFPEYSDKVYMIRHGTHLYPGIARMSRGQAKARLHEYLVGESGLDQASKDDLRQQRVFLDPDTLVMGMAGFITASKGTELLYHARDLLQQMLPRRKIAAVHAGSLREVDNSVDSKFTAELRAKRNSPGQFLLETYLSEDILPLLLRALDIYFYWPSDCTQSGILSYALGAGATIACRDMEGVGETVKMAGGLAYVDFEQAIAGLKELILHPKLMNEMSERAVKYAEGFSWRNQASQHFELAERLCQPSVQRLFRTLPLTAASDASKKPPPTLSGKTSHAAQ